MPANNFLTTVMRERRQDAQGAGQTTSLAELKRQWVAGRVCRSLNNAWRLPPTAAATPCIIAEVKKASPSAGLLSRDYHPAALASAYEKAGAAAISVLTEPRHFQGSADDLRAVRQAVKLPILRKDFIGEPYQVIESAVLGADIVLLIAAALEPQRLRALYTLATEIGLEALVEVHSRKELEQAAQLDKAIVGVNSRNLVTLQTDLSIARHLAAYLPKDRLCIAESGIRHRRDIEELQALGYRGFLIGEALMRAPNAGARLRSLLAAEGAEI